MSVDNNETSAWSSEIHVHSSNYSSVPAEVKERGTIDRDYAIYHFTILEISSFYSLYRISNKWKRTKFFVNNTPITYSPNITKTFKCFAEASKWPESQNEWFRKNNCPTKDLTIRHYCYGYGRTIYNIVGCQRIKAARDNRLLTGDQIKNLPDKEGYRNNREGWMNRRFVNVKDNKFEVDIEGLRNQILLELNSGPIHCPFLAKDRISYGLRLLEELTKSASHFWVIEEDGTVNPQPIEYYFDIPIDKRFPLGLGGEHSLVYFILLSGILRLSLYETVLLIAAENPALGFTIGFSDHHKSKVYVKFESLKQLGFA